MSDPISFEDKVQESKDLISRHFVVYGSSMFLGHSGGKDSCVIFDLASQVNAGLRVVHNPKPEVGPITREFLYQFSMGYPVAFVPPICMPTFLKKNMLRVQIDGTRKAEYARTDRSKTVIVSGKEISRENMPQFAHGGVFGMSILYPIVDWSDDDVWRYIHENKIRVSNEYSYRARQSEGVLK